MATVKCSYQNCNNEFEQRDGKKYCSGSCRAKASILNRASLGNLPTMAANQAHSTKANFNIQSDPTSAYIISHLTGERDRWMNDFNKEREARKKLKEEKEALEKKIRDMEYEQRIAAIENAKPSGLNGLLSTPAGEKLLEAAAPLIQRMLEAQPAQIAGTNGQTPAALFEAWFSKLSMQGKQIIWDMLKIFSTMPEAELINYARQVIESLAPTYAQANGTN
jgi:hypothetical protein